MTIELSCAFATSPESHEHARIAEALGYRRAFFFDSPALYSDVCAISIAGTRWADTRIHGTTKRQVAAMFVEERPSLRPLPLEPFRYYQFGRRTVHLDNCLEVDAGYYSAPPGWLGQEGSRRAVERQPRPPARSAHRPAPARAPSPRPARPARDPPRRSAGPDATEHGPARPLSAIPGCVGLGGVRPGLRDRRARGR